MSFRRLVGAVLLLAWVTIPSLAVASAATGDGHDGCSDHVCQCRKPAQPSPASHCPPKRTAAKSCHEDGEGEPASAPSCSMTSRCGHDSAAAAPPAFRSDWAPRPSEGLRVGDDARRAVAAAAERPRAGHPRLDIQPPRTAS
jgi:hypothetical protein